MPQRKRNGVVAVERSRNTKVGDVSATYVGQGSCPSSCPLLGRGCYAETGHVGMVTNRVNASRAGQALLAHREANAIRRLSGERPLRLHVVGDCATEQAARIVAGACDDYRARHGQPIWTYTHAWRDVPRAAWGSSVSVLASCETASDVKRAHVKGYATAIVVEHHDGDKRVERDSIKMLPCPQQTRGISCDRCRLCWDRSTAPRAADDRFCSARRGGSQSARGCRCARRKGVVIMYRCPNCNHSDGMSALRAEYYSHVRDCAKDLAERYRRGHFGSRDDLLTAIHEEVDSDRWVFVTYQAKIVALVSDHAGAIDEYWCRSAIAYCAMERDLIEALEAGGEDWAGIDVNAEPCSECCASGRVDPDEDDTEVERGADGKIDCVACDGQGWQ